MVGLEYPSQEQPLLDAYLASRGGPGDRAALLAGAFWRRDFHTAAVQRRQEAVAPAE